VYEPGSDFSKTMSDTKEETKEEKKETKTEDEPNREAYTDILNYLMTNPETGERWSYAESRERYG
jgi:hypothetical protein